MPAPAQWTYVLTDLAGTTLGELTGASDRSLQLPLNRVPTASFRVPLWHPLAPAILGGDTLVKVYRRGTDGTNRLLFNGPTLSVEETGDENFQNVAVTATGPFWRLTKRFVGQSKAGFSYGIEGADAQGNPTGVVDLGLIAHYLLDVANGAGYTGISKGTRSNSTNGGVGPWYLKNIAEAIAELSAGINSFDYEVVPTEPAAPINGIPQIGLLNIAPLIGAQKPDAVFLYGGGRANVKSYSRQISRDAILNRAIIALPGWPDGVKPEEDIIVRSDNASITARGVYEDVVSDAGVIDPTLRTLIADEHLKYRASPRQIVTFTIATNARPEPFLDYKVGDWVRGIATVRGSVRFDAMFRIWGMSFSLDQNGNESLDLQLVQE